MYNLSTDLNPTQRVAAEQIEGPVLVLAGAGTGKTRVITYRIAHLVEDYDVRPSSIFAVTFTNKAAGEMKDRISSMVGTETGKYVWASTFHSACAKILRQHINQLERYNRNFTIYSSNEQRSLLKELIKTLNFRGGASINSPAKIQHIIGKLKRAMLTPEKFALSANENFDKNIAQVFKAYQQTLQKNNALDFDDLILKTIELLQRTPEIQKMYHEKFHYIMVDEFQDTNEMQYVFVNLMTNSDHNICVVGDDDQSIYSFRGASIENIRRFTEDYKNTKIFSLEQNYRSTKAILGGANAMIRNNSARLKNKQLWTENQLGNPIACYEATSENDEVCHVIDRIKLRKSTGGEYSDCAIFYRTNAQSRAFETALVQENIPYQIVKGMRFYDRKEIKDLISYLQLVVNPIDSNCLARIINVPRRGIGQTTIERLKDFAIENGISLFEAILRLDEIRGIRSAQYKRISEFIELIGRFTPGDRPAKVLREILRETRYAESLTVMETDETKSQTRADNVAEFLRSVDAYERENIDATLADFVENVMLMAGIDSLDEKKKAVKLMTLHSAKGLEFPIVFIVGVEEGILPHRSSSNTLRELEEERRLCYVGITRSKEQVYLTYNSQRSFSPSRFTHEIPGEFLRKTNGYTKPISNTASIPPAPAPVRSEKSAMYKMNEPVRHDKFGAGVITRIIGDGNNARVTVHFNRIGERTMFAKYANLRNNS